MNTRFLLFKAGKSGLIALLLICFQLVGFSQTNLVVNGDFGVASGCPQSSFTSDYSCDPTATINGPGHFGIGTNAYTWNGPWWGTSRTADATNFIVADGGTAPNTRIWIQNVNVVSGQEYTFSIWARNIVNPGSGAGTESALPTVSLRVNNSVIATSISLPQMAANTWTEVTGNYTASSTGSITLDVFQNLTGQYNDVAIDDISFMASSTTNLFDDNSFSSNIVVAPNPFSEETTVSIESASGSKNDIVMELYSLSGSLIQRQSLMATEKLRFGRSLNKGMYVLKLHLNGSVQTIKLIKE